MSNDDFAWQVHSALGDWTARVDIKASIVLGLESAALGLILALSQGAGPLHGLTRARLDIFYGGVASISLSIILAIAVVFPQLSRRRAKRTWRDNTIYFGHLRRWNDADLAQRLASANAAPLDQLARQLIIVSKIAWRKHVFLQYSMVALLGGLLLVGGSAIM